LRSGYFKDDAVSRPMDADGTGPLERAGRHRNALVLSPPFTPGGDGLCFDLSYGGPEPPDGLVFVLATRSPDDRLHDLRDHAGDALPPRLGFLTLGETRRSSTCEGVAAADDGLELWTETVASPGNLTEVGVTLSNRLLSWEHVTGEVAVCFEPLGTLLQYSDVRQVYRFVHVFTQQARSTGARVHFHLDPSAHDDIVTNQLKTLFDAVVEVDGDGQVSVRSR